MKPVREMTDAELDVAREQVDDEVRSLNDVLRRLNDEIWLRKFDRDTANIQAEARLANVHDGKGSG